MEHFDLQHPQTKMNETWSHYTLTVSHSIQAQSIFSCII